MFSCSLDELIAREEASPSELAEKSAREVAFWRVEEDGCRAARVAQRGREGEEEEREVW